jgi:hypothetical protein
MPSHFDGRETSRANLPDEPKVVWDVIPGVSIRLRGAYRSGQKAYAHQALYYGPFARPLRWLVDLPQEKKLELGALIVSSDRYLYGTPNGVVGDWLVDHGFPDWEECCDPEGCWEPCAFRPSEWRLLPLWEPRFVEVDRTFRVGDRARTVSGAEGEVVRITDERVGIRLVGPRGGDQKASVRFHAFAEANR